MTVEFSPRVSPALPFLLHNCRAVVTASDFARAHFGDLIEGGGGGNSSM